MTAPARDLPRHLRAITDPAEAQAMLEAPARYDLPDWTPEERAQIIARRDRLARERAARRGLRL